MMWLSSSIHSQSGTGGKLRPALGVQCDDSNHRLTNVIFAAITTRVHHSDEPTQLLIEIGTLVWRQSGLVKDSVVSCENLATIAQDRVVRRIGSLPNDAMTQVNLCLKASLGIP